jgi:hypothetical protein
MFLKKMSVRHLFSLQRNGEESEKDSYQYKSLRVASSQRCLQKLYHSFS